MPARCPSDCPLVASAKDVAAFNTHSPGGGGSGLAQQVFRSPARIPASEAGRKGLCAAPASEKRYSLSGIVDIRIFYCSDGTVNGQSVDRTPTPQTRSPPPPANQPARAVPS